MLSNQSNKGNIYYGDAMVRVGEKWVNTKELREAQEAYEKGELVEVPHTISQEDLDANPELVKLGIKVGEVVGLPVTQEEAKKLAKKK